MGKAERDYTRKTYQALMDVVEALDRKAPLSMTQKQIHKKTGLSKGVVFDVCWNLAQRGWAEEVGDGAVMLKRGTGGKDAYVGRMVARIVSDAHGVDIDDTAGE